MGKRTVNIAPIISDRMVVLTTVNSITIFVNVGFDKILLAMPYLASWPILRLVEDRVTYTLNSLSFEVSQRLSKFEVS